MVIHAEEQKINIRPGVKILSVLSHLNYKPWFAIAEFVDNSIQSFLAHRSAISQIDRVNAKLRVEIELDSSDAGRLIIRDNAAGIHQEDYMRAFRPAATPLDRTGLSEFGMGMKSAACWFSPKWTVRTSALGEPVEKTITFDIEQIVQNEIEELSISSRSIAENIHFTEIMLTDLHNVPQKKTISKIKEHLCSIYRIFLREGVLDLRYNGEELRFPEVDILRAPSYTKESDEKIRWYKKINFDFGQGMSISGFAAIRTVASTSEAGFALFRRNRLIQGSADETYRPNFIFGSSNSYKFQRIFGELHLEGFDVSHTKDGFQWDENEQPFLELLKEHLDTEPIPLLRQAENYRSREKVESYRKGAEESTRNVSQTVEREAPKVIERQIQTEPEKAPPTPDLAKPNELAASKTITIQIYGQKWEITIELTNDPGVGEWISYSEHERLTGIRRINIRLSLAHPFMLQFGGKSVEQIEPLQRVAVAIVLSEITARESGVRNAGTFRRNVNDLLRNALAS